MFIVNNQPQFVTLRGLKCHWHSPVQNINDYWSNTQNRAWFWLRWLSECVCIGAWWKLLRTFCSNFSCCQWFVDIFQLISFNISYPLTCDWHDNSLQWRHILLWFTPYHCFILFKGVDSSFLSRTLDVVLYDCGHKWWNLLFLLTSVNWKTPELSCTNYIFHALESSTNIYSIRCAKMDFVYMLYVYN